MSGGTEEVAIFIAKTDTIIAVVQAEAADISDKPRVIDAE